jgi:hypothetical protein
MKRITTVLLLTFIFTFTIQSCRRWFHAECRSGYQVNRGEIVVSLVYNCLIFDPDSKGDTTAYTRQTQWDSLWVKLIAKNGNSCPKPAIDFTKNDVLTYYQEFENKYKIIREVTFDHANKQVIYTITQFRCENGNSMGLNENLVVIPKIPSGYSVIWKTVSK